MDIKELFCPVCKNKNDRNAIFCKYCGASLSYKPGESAATTVNTGGLEKDGVKLSDSFIDENLIPEDGIAIYAAGTSKPIYLHFDRELVFGRTDEKEFNDSLLDLTELGGYQMGISRRHAMIRRVETGYEIIDLASTNGSWLNNERLVPNKPYRLASGAQLRFGRMQLLILYHRKKNKTK